MEKRTFAGFCAIMQTLPAQNKWDDAIASVYLSAMSDWDDAVVGLVMKEVLNTCEYRPTIAEIRKIAIRLIDPKLSGDEIYQQIKSILNNVPPDNRTNHVHNMIATGKAKPELARVVAKCGGWPALRTMETQEVKSTVMRAVSEVYETTDFGHVFTHPANSPAIERGRETAKALEQ
jgi:hypothetical protein